jgi:hypothetical protein
MSTPRVKPPAADIVLKWMIALASVVAALTACGGDGGVGVGGSGAPPVGLAEGTVTSLSLGAAAGSIHGLDGTGFDTTSATVQAERAPGLIAPAEIKLGHHVEIDFEVDRVAKTVRVEPAVVGAVSQRAFDTLTVLGQQVFINTNAGLGPVTVFEGFTSLAEVTVGQVVEVHGLARRNLNGVYVLQATRVERLSAAPPAARLAGVVTDLSPGVEGADRIFTIGSQRVAVPPAVADTAQLQDLQNGWTVVVFGTPVFNPASALTVLRAQQVQIKRRVNFGVDAYFGGTLTRLDPAAKTFEVNGVPVRYAAAVFNGPAPAENQYLQMRGNFAVDGTFDATLVTVRGEAQVEEEDDLEFEGTVSAVDAVARVFVLQGYAIYVVPETRIDDCANGVRAGQFVEVDARLVAGNIVADRVRCR